MGFVGTWQIYTIATSDLVKRVADWASLTTSINTALSSINSTLSNAVTALGPAWAPFRNVPADQNMNTFRVPGLHRISTPDTATITNLPPGMRSAGLVENLITGDGTDTWWVQRVTEMGKNPRTWWRVSLDTLGVFNAWALEGTQASEVTEWHVFLAAGQSNMAGRAIVSASNGGKYVQSRIRQFGYNNRVLETATVPLDMHDATTAPSQGLSPASVFANAYLRNQPPHVGVLIVPAAHGGTGFTTSTTTQTWTPGITSNPLYDLPGAAVAQVTAALAAVAATGAAASLKGILWHQGEDNSTMSKASYITNLDALISYFRTQFGNAKLPFVLGQMAPENIAAVPGRINIDAAHQETPGRVLYTGLALARTNGYNPGDQTHMSEEGVQYLGRNYVDALRDAQLNTGVAATNLQVAKDYADSKDAAAAATAFQIKANLGTEDLDTVMTPGLYGQAVSGNATTERHYPFGTSARGELLVTKPSASIVAHEYTATFLQRKAIREYNGTTWSTWKEITSGVGTSSTKLVGTALTLASGPELNTTTTDYGARLLLDYGVTIPKWRLHVRNYNARDDLTFTGALSLMGFTVGEAELNNGAPTGRWVGGTTTLVQGAATTPADGSEWVSNWFTVPLDAAKKYMLSYGFTAAGGQVVHHGMGPVWNLAGGSVDVHDAAVYGSRSTLPALDIWMECEVPATVPVKGATGDSLTIGHSSTSPVHDSFLAAHCRTVGALPVFWAASGDTLANFADGTKPKATRYDGMARPDVLYVAMGGNDIFGSNTSLATTQGLLHATLNMLRSHATSNLVLCSVWPRLDAALPAEDVRQAYNEWLKTTLPGGATMYKDTAAVLLDPSNPRLLDTKWTASPTNIHLSTAGYARAAEVL